MQQFDIVIIGAGPAGSAAAVTAAHAGLSVALVDKARFPRAKLCGGLVTGRARLHYERIFGVPLDPDLFQPRRHIAFYMDGAPLGPARHDMPMHLTMRWDMDAHLFDRARAAGALDFTGRRVAALDLDAAIVTLSDGRALRYRVLIGADGVNSLVARQLFGRAFDPARIGFALEIEAPADPADEIVRIDFGAAQWGYGWRFPKRGSTTIGLGGLLSRNPDMTVALDAHRARLGDCSDAAVKGHHLPFGDPCPRPGRGNVLLAGDAAGLVDPITGEGIAHALLSGQSAARAAARALAEGRPARALRHHHAGIAPILRAIRMARLLRPLIFSRRCSGFFRHAFASSQRVKRDYLRLLAGEIEYPGLMATVLRRLPAALWRRLRRA